MDFDGTLSHIVQIPSEARPVPGAVEVLSLLAHRFAVVSVVSGRSAHQLLQWLGPSVDIWGVHGAETVVDGKVVLAPRAERYRDLMARVLEAAQERVDAMQMKGILIEDKTVMIGLHFRDAEDVATAQRMVEIAAEELADEYGLDRATGKLVIELRPPERFSKEDVILTRARSARLEAVFFAGDDRVDVPAFDALDMLAAEGVATVRVAVASDETPTELVERADIVVYGPDEAVRLLESLTR